MAKEAIEAAENKKSLSQEYFEEKAEKSKENRRNGGDDVEIDLVGTVLGRMTKDFGFLKKGHEQMFSTSAFEIYSAKGVIEKVN